MCGKVSFESLVDVMGDDDMFSSDLTDAQLASRLGPVQARAPSPSARPHGRSRGRLPWNTFARSRGSALAPLRSASHRPPQHRVSRFGPRAHGLGAPLVAVPDRRLPVSRARELQVC